MDEINGKNHTSRVGYEFNKMVEKINEERIAQGKKKMSIVVLTNLLIKHNSFPLQYADFVKYDLKEKNGK